MFALSVTNGQGADSAIVTVGVTKGEHIGQAFNAIRKAGTVVVTGLGDINEVGIPVSPAMLTLFQKRIQGCLYGMMAPSADVPRLLHAVGNVRASGSVGVKPRVDNIPPGGLVTLDIFLRTNALTPVTVREVFRAIQPQFQGKFRMSRQVLALDGSEKIAFGQTLGDALSVIIPPTGLELSTSEAGLREARLMSVNARAVAGSTSATALQMESASLAMPLIRAASAVFVEEPILGRFTAKISQAGGKRLIGSVQQNIILQAIATKSALEITYSIAEAGTVDVSLYDILGRKIQTLSESYQEAGAYNGIFRMDNLFTTPSGSYFIVLRTQSGIVQQRVDIIR